MRSDQKELEIRYQRTPALGQVMMIRLGMLQGKKRT